MKIEKLREFKEPDLNKTDFTVEFASSRVPESANCESHSSFAVVIDAIPDVEIEDLVVEITDPSRGTIIDSGEGESF